MNADAPRIDVILVNYHRPELTDRALAAVLAAEDVRARAILIDNEAHDDWAASRAACEPRVTARSNVENLGFGAACNQGIELALAGDAETVMLLNNDAWPAAGALGRLARAAREHGAAAPKILLPDGRIYSAGGSVELARARARNRGIYAADDGRFDQPDLLRFASACALMLRRDLLEDGLRFHEPYFLYYEDVELCLELARRTGTPRPIRYEPAAVIVHEESASSGGTAGARLVYYNTRNRWLMLRRRPGDAQVWLGKVSWFAANAARLCGELLAGRPAHARAYARGMRDAWAGRYGRCAEYHAAAARNVDAAVEAARPRSGK